MQSVRSCQVLDDSSSDSDGCSNYYSGAAKRFKQCKEKDFRTGQVKLINKAKDAAPVSGAGKKSPSPVEVSDSSDEEIFRDVNCTEVETEDELEDIEQVNQKQVETLEDVEEFIHLSPDDDVPCHIEDRRNQSSSSIHMVEDEDDIEKDPLDFTSLNESELNNILDDNERVIVKVRLLSVVHRIEMTRVQHFKVLVQQLAEKLSLDPNKLSLEFKDEPLDPYATLKAVPIGITDIVEAAVVNEAIIAPAEDAIELKVQSQARGSQVMISIRPEEPMSVLIQKYADATAIDPSKLTFKFDGDLLDPDDTPASLDLEGGECIDVFIRE